MSALGWYLIVMGPFVLGCLVGLYVRRSWIDDAPPPPCLGYVDDERLRQLSPVSHERAGRVERVQRPR